MLSVPEGDLQKSWHLLGLLLSIGEPTTLPELASRCSLFSADPSLISRLCSIPDSPISLNNDYFVEISAVGLSALAAYVSRYFRFNQYSSPSIPFRDAFRLCLGKRKRIEDGEERRLVPQLKRTRNHIEIREVHHNVADSFSRVISPINLSNVVNQVIPRALFRAETSVEGEIDLYKVPEELTGCESGRPVLALPYRISDQIDIEEVVSCFGCSPQTAGQTVVSPVETGNEKVCCETTNVRVTDEEVAMIDSQKELLNDLACGKQEIDELCPLLDTYVVPDSESESAKRVDGESMIPSPDDDPTAQLGPSCDNQVVNSSSFKQQQQQPDSSLKKSVQTAEQMVVSPVETGHEKACCETTNIRVTDEEVAMIDSKKEQLNDLACQKQETDELCPLLDTREVPDSESESIKRVNGESKMPSPDEDPTAQVGAWGDNQVAELFVFKQQQQPETSVKRSVQRDAVVAPKLPTVTKVVGQSMNVYTSRKKRHLKGECMPVPVVQQQDQNNDMEIKERRGTFSSISSKDQLKPRGLPKFEPYIVECEEGSGGYGTVYRARRRDNGALVAIKCPHENAHRQHITNELKMLERFGGKNFVIKYQGSFKSADGLDCFILEHVEHDRPEVLKKEIEVFELEWYAYCMFRALLGLHRQGVVHRDVKPGNFLFSRKTTKGYLIDFNLAMDLHQKNKASIKSKVEYDTTPRQFPLPSTKLSYPSKSSKFQNAKTLEVVNPIEAKNGKKKAACQKKANKDLNRCINSQGADGSGITSAKDGSTKTRSADRLRQPLPNVGRKSLINYLHDEVQNKKHEVPVSRVPAPMRKRVVASPGNLDRPLNYHTPMPLSGEGLMKTKGDGTGKHKKEGPCAGTKGFRAPEVLLRSPHQGPKVDVWSAGVTLLYLIIGRSPFFGDPEQNMKDIVKLRGSEALWEVAKLHNRESSFPEELYDYQALSSMNLQEWCRFNTKRRDFIDEIPSSLFDLVDRCLTVNPRLRISAEDALNHEFFASVNESLRKQRSSRQAQSLDSKTNLFHGEIASKPPRVHLEQALA